MAKSQHKKLQEAEWDAKHMRIVAAKVKKNIAIDFHILARREGTTAGTLLREYIEEYIAQHERHDIGAAEGKKEEKDPGKALKT